MTGDDVEAAVIEMRRVLDPCRDRDWQAKAGGLEWTCWATAGHVARDLFAYAAQVAAQPASSYLPFTVTVAPDTEPAVLLDVVGAGGRLLRDVVAAARPDDRAWHWGPTDPGGFAALGVNEVLVHTYDITCGLGVDWWPPDALAAAVVDRLFPDAPAGTPGRVLLWSTGRIELGGRARPTRWVPVAAVR